MAGKIVGEVVKITEHNIILRNPALLSFRMEPRRGGTSFGVMAVLQGWMPYTEIYALARAGLRGEGIVHENWLVDLYNAHQVRALSGAFRLDPTDQGVSVELTPGEGHTEPTATEVGEVGEALAHVQKPEGGVETHVVPTVGEGLERLEGIPEPAPAEAPQATEKAPDEGTNG